jgi:hypothetical protein
MLIRLITILAITYAVLTYVLHLTPHESMFIYAGTVAVLFPSVEIYFHTRS